MQTIKSLRRAVKPLLLGAAGVALVAGATGYGTYYWRTARFLESTDDAYVQADYTAIAPKVPGYIEKVLVSDNERVKAGQVLARIDDRDLVTARDQAKADVASAQAAVTTLDAQIQLQHTLIEQAKAAVEADDAIIAVCPAGQCPLLDAEHQGLWLRAAGPAGRRHAARAPGGAAA